MSRVLLASFVAFLPRDFPVPLPNRMLIERVVSGTSYKGIVFLTLSYRGAREQPILPDIYTPIVLLIFRINFHPSLCLNSSSFPYSKSTTTKSRLRILSNTSSHSVNQKAAIMRILGKKLMIWLALIIPIGSAEDTGLIGYVPSQLNVNGTHFPPQIWH